MDSQHIFEQRADGLDTVLAGREYRAAGQIEGQASVRQDGEGILDPQCRLFIVGHLECSMRLMHDDAVHSHVILRFVGNRCACRQGLLPSGCC